MWWNMEGMYILQIAEDFVYHQECFKNLSP
jgi:hypothetical protein